MLFIRLSLLVLPFFGNRMLNNRQSSKIRLYLCSQKWGIPSDHFQALQPFIHHKTISLQKHRFISYFHAKVTVSSSAYSHKRPVVAGISQMSASWWSPLRSIWIPVHCMDTEYRTIISGLLLHSINLLVPPKHVGGDSRMNWLHFVPSTFPTLF